MKKTVLTESVARLRGIAAALLAEPFSAATGAGADLRQAVGNVMARAEEYARGACFGGPLADCFSAAIAAGMSADSFMRVRVGIASNAAVWPVGEIINSLGVRLALASECHALAGQAVESRAQVDSLIARLRAAFEPTLDYAMDNHDGEGFKALSALYAAVVRDLTERGRQLPRMAHYDTWRGLPALVLAHRLYADASRAGELALENAAINPIFMPAQGRALSR